MKTRVSSWNIPEKTILNLSSQKNFPMQGTELVTILLSAYRNIYKPKAKLIIYKACPFMPWHINESISHSPEIKYIHIIRDPRAVYSSQKKSIDPFSGKPYSSSPLKTAMEWKKAVTSFSQHKRENTIQVKFEDLVQNSIKTLNTIIKSLHVSNKKELQDVILFKDRMESVDREFHRQINEKPNPSKIEAWKNSLSEKEIKKIEYYLNKLLSIENYKNIYSIDQISNFDAISIKLNGKTQSLLLLLKRIKRLFIRLIINPKYLLTQIKLKFND